MEQSLINLLNIEDVFLFCSNILLKLLVVPLCLKVPLLLNLFASL